MSDADENVNRLFEMVGFVAFTLGILLGAVVMTLLYQLNPIEVEAECPCDRVQLPYYTVRPLEDTDGQ